MKSQIRLKSSMLGFAYTAEMIGICLLIAGVMSVLVLGESRGGDQSIAHSIYSQFVSLFEHLSQEIGKNATGNG